MEGLCRWLPFGGRLIDVLHGVKPSTYPCDMPVVGDLVRGTSGRWMIRPPTRFTWFVLFGVAALLTFAAASSPDYAARTPVRDGARATQAPDADFTPDFA